MAVLQLRKKKTKQQVVDDYLAWSYADPKYREFTDRMVLQYLDTGIKPDIRKEFKNTYG